MIVNHWLDKHIQLQKEKLQLNLKHKYCADAQQKRTGGVNTNSKLDNFSQLLLATTDSNAARVVVRKLRCESECNFPFF